MLVANAQHKGGSDDWWIYSVTIAHPNALPAPRVTGGRRNNSDEEIHAGGFPDPYETGAGLWCLAAGHAVV